MRIIALLGLGLPILAISGAVAFAAIQEISKVATAVPAVQPVAVQQPVLPRAVAFVAAGKVDLAPRPETAFFSSGFHDGAVVTQAPDGLAAPPTRASDIDRPEVVVASSPSLEPAPVLRRAQPRPSPALAPVPVAKEVQKRSFTMPWQTGIFQ